MSYICNDLSILDLQRKADAFLGSSKILKHFYCFKESSGLIQRAKKINSFDKERMTFHGWFMRTGVLLVFTFLPADKCPVPFYFSCRISGCRLTFTHMGKHMDMITVWVEFPCSLQRRTQPGTSGCSGASVTLQGACGSSSLQGYQCSCWGRCGNKRCCLPLSPYGAMLHSVCPAISPTINRALPLSPPSCYNLLKR